MIRHVDFSHRGLKLAASVEGPANGTPVVLLHGGGQTRHSWGKSMSALARAGFCAYALDLRGHGDSGWAEDADYQPSAYADDLRHVAREIGRPLAVVGASLGGIAALFACGERPAIDALCLVLVDITSRAEKAGIANITGFMGGTLGGFDTLEDAADAIARYLPHRKRPSDLSGLAKNLRRRDDGRYYWHWDPRMHWEPPKDGSGMNDDRLEAAAQAFHGPALVLRGGRSELVSPKGARAFAKFFRRGELVEIEGAHHMVAGDANDPFSDALVDFVRRNTATERR